MSVCLCSLISLLQCAVGDSLGDSPPTPVEGAFQPLGPRPEAILGTGVLCVLLETVLEYISTYSCTCLPVLQKWYALYIVLHHAFLM